MPSRKSLPGDLHSDHGRSSMRRLSSIASLHQLLTFSRSRRSNGETEIPSSSEESFLSASTSTSAIDSTESSCTQSSQDGHQSQLVSSSSTSLLKHSEHTSVPEKPLSGIPRSKTFGSLPLPLASRKKQPNRRQATTITKNNHSSPIPPSSSRLPTPTGSNRKYLPFLNRAANQSVMGPPRSKLKRSDTEPLLTTKMDQEQTYHRSAAFTEDVSASSARMLPSTPCLTDSSPQLKSACSHLGSKDKPLPLPRDPSFCGMLPTTPKKSLSSPVHAPFDDKTPTQRSYLAATAPAARHHNALADITNCYQSNQKVGPVVAGYGQDVESKNAVGDIADRTSVPIHDLTNAKQKPAPLRVVLDAQPTSYWSGRLSSLLDRYQGQEIAASFGTSGSIISRFETDKLHAPSASTNRMRRAFEELYSTCATIDAKESFIAFQLQYAALRNEPELAKPIGPRAGRPAGYLTASSKSLKIGTSTGLPHPTSSGRKTSFVDRLLGRNKRNSLA